MKWTDVNKDDKIKIGFFRQEIVAARQKLENKIKKIERYKKKYKYKNKLKKLKQKLKDVKLLDISSKACLVGLKNKKYNIIKN